VIWAARAFVQTFLDLALSLLHGRHSESRAFSRPSSWHLGRSSCAAVRYDRCNVPKCQMQLVAQWGISNLALHISATAAFRAEPHDISGRGTIACETNGTLASRQLGPFSARKHDDRGICFARTTTQANCSRWLACRRPPRPLSTVIYQRQPTLKSHLQLVSSLPSKPRPPPRMTMITNHASTSTMILATQRPASLSHSILHYFHTAAALCRPSGCNRSGSGSHFPPVCSSQHGA